MKILIAGFPYIRENYFNTWQYYPAQGKIFFLLPKSWKVKRGKIIYYPPKHSNVFSAKAYFHHSHYPVIGGLLKGWIPAFPFILWKLKREKKINIVYSSSEPILITTLYQAFWSKLFGLKHIIFTWENIPYENKFKGLNLLLKKVIIKLNLLLSDGIVCGNRKAEDIFKRLTKKPVVIIPMSGVNTDFFHKVNTDDFLETHGLKNKLIFSFAGAIGHRKGIHNMICAFKKVLSALPNACLVIAGTGEYEKDISELITELDLEYNIIKIPWLSPIGLRELLSVSNIFLYPSISFGGWEEQFGYSMAEASLMEVPIISTRTGSIEEVVLNGVTGLLVEPENIKDLIEAMFKLGKDEGLRNEFGKAGRIYIEENFSYQVVANKFYNFFQFL